MEDHKVALCLSDLALRDHVANVTMWNTFEWG